MNLNKNTNNNYCLILKRSLVIYLYSNTVLYSIEQQQRSDRQGALGPDANAPFADNSDAVRRLVRYHCLDEPVFSESDLHKADEIFEATARHLLDKNAQMLNKYKYLLLMESMVSIQRHSLAVQVLL